MYICFYFALAVFLIDVVTVWKHLYFLFGAGY